MSQHPTSSVADMRKDLGDLLSRAHYQNERIIVTKRERPFASVVSLPDTEKLDRLDEIAAYRGMTSETLMAEIEKAFALNDAHASDCESASNAESAARTDQDAA